MDGYKTVEDLSSFNNWTQSFRYKTLKLEKNGQFFLFKKANDDFTKQLLKNEVRWREFFDKVDIKDVSNTEIAEEGEDYLLFEWLDADLLAERSESAMPGFERNLERYVDLMATIYLAAVGYKPAGNEATAIKPESRYDSPLAYEERLKTILQAGWITQDRIDQINQLYEKYLPYAKGGYQHGDFTPWHVFVSGNKWFIYDAEHASSLRSCFTDVIHTYNRLACQCKSADLASRMLKKFIERIGMSPDDFKNLAMAEFTKKAAGSVIDAFNDRRELKYKNEANSFLDKVLSDNLDELLS